MNIARHTAPLLSVDEFDQYQKDGQLTPRWRMPPDLMARLKTALERRLEDQGGQPTDFIPLPHYAADGPSRASRDLAREFFEIVKDPTLLDLVETVIGPDIVMWASALFCKPAATGLEVPWHQDGQYWPIRPRANVTVWIAIDDVDVDNGCMRVIPGSHRVGEFRHIKSDRDDLVLNTLVDDPRLELDSARNVVLEAGQVSLHDVDVVHGSQPNTSGRRRAAYAIRYMPATSLYDRDVDPGQGSATVPLDFTERPIWLLRGVDKHGGNDFSIGHTDW